MKVLSYAVAVLAGFAAGVAYALYADDPVDPEPCPCGARCLR
jgi:hypothetical protein